MKSYFMYFLIYYIWVVIYSHNPSYMLYLAAGIIHFSYLLQRQMKRLALTVRSYLYFKAFC